MPASSSDRRAALLSVRAALHQAVQQLQAITSSPHLEAELLLAEVLGRERVYLHAHPEALLTTAQALTFAAWLARRLGGEPLPYITGHSPFFGLEFIVTPDVLIPRPETELLVEQALVWLGKASPAPQTVVDVGTGSGCILVALATHAPNVRGLALDLSLPALALARANARRHGVAARITCVAGDLLAPLAGPVDLILSNPPYIAEREWEELPLSVRREPRMALLSGPSGLDAIRRLLAQARTRLRPGGLLLVEIGEEQGESVLKLASVAFPQAKIVLRPDLAGRDRMLMVQRAVV